jgi:methionyl-tRNA synthetase
VAGLLDRAEITQALDRIWQRVRRLNRYVEEQAPWQLAKDPAQAERLQTVLRSLAEGLRVVTVLLSPYMPESTAKLLAALGDERLALSAAAFGDGPGGAAVGELAPLFPKPQ